ncbi:GldG family protein [Candidatus Roizmanbacteria bacterium]|nr:GldG family protein [Candidatus Roizmanbacteria bacterium]
MIRTKLKKINLVKAMKLERFGKSLIYPVTLGIFILINLIISSLSARADLSSGKAYTLSQSTKKILKKTDDIVNIKFFASSNLPTKLLPLRSEVVDLLNEYKKEGGGKVAVKVIDPKKDDESLSQAKEAGIPELQFSQLEQDKYALTAAYFGISVSYAEKKEVIPQANDIDNLEYNLTSLIYKLTQKNMSQIGLLGGGFESLRKSLDQYALLPISDLKVINSSYKALLILDDNKKQYSTEEADILNKYFAEGGRAIIFADGVWITDSLQSTKAEHNLGPVLKKFGITVDNDLVLSSLSEMVNFGNDSVQFLVPYPFWVKTNVFNQGAGYFSNFNQLSFPWVSSLSFEKVDGVEIRRLVYTGNRSWTQKEGNIFLNPQTIPQPNEKDFRQYTIIAEARNKKNGQILVVPSSRFIGERYLSKTSGNVNFIINALNDLASGGALSGIRQRTVLFYPLPEMSESQKEIFKYLNIFLLPGIFVLCGAFRLVKRK